MDIQTMFRNSEFIYYIKLMNGESIIGKSNDDQEKINTMGQVILFDVMKMTNRLVQHENGSISEITGLAPWMEACDLETEVAVPIETIVAIALAKDQVSRKYSAYVLASHIKEASAVDSEKVAAEVAVEKAIAASSKLGMHQPLEPSDSTYQEPRKPELLTREKMLEAELDGEIEDLEEEDLLEEEDPHYRVGNITYH